MVLYQFHTYPICFFLFFLFYYTFEIQKTHLVGAVDEPMRKFLKIYPSVNDAVREHDRAAAEYEKARERYEKQQRSASSDSVKMEKVMVIDILSSRAPPSTAADLVLIFFIETPYSPPINFQPQLERQRDQAQKAWELVDTTLPEVCEK